MTQLTISCLGTFEVKLDGTSVTHFRSANVQGLLIHLALEAERPFPRETLAALFWPEANDNVARQNLRQSLYQLRKVLDAESQERPFLHVTRQTVQFNNESEHSLDVREFLGALDNGDLETAVSLYTGDLLPGFTCDSIAFEDWLRGERERLHGFALKAMADLSARQLRNGRVARAQATARRQLELEPWSERAHRQLITALALAGDRGGALAQFARCRDILEAELGLPPEPETIALVKSIQNNELHPVNPDLIAGRYIPGVEIGRGAMGVVLRGRDSRSGAAVAIKQLGAAAIAAKSGLVARFQQEGEALRRLNHPNIVHLLAVDEKDGCHYLVMEYIPGGDLRQRLQQEGALPLKQALTIALDLADALTRAHRLEILHRDIKPGNVLLDDDGLPRLADFGLARLGQESLLTAPDNIMGTVAYLSPEACLGEALDARADIWSFGVLLYEMLLGEQPFAAPTSAGIINQILNTSLPDIMALRPEMPEALADLLYRILAKSKADRIPSVRLVGAELEAILHEKSWESDREQGAGPPPSGRPAFATPTTERMRRMRHNLPAQATPFVGREAELAELERLLADPSLRLVTILGPGGMGKTRLSLEIAERMAQRSTTTPVTFPDGIFLVELATSTSAEQMLTAVAAALGFPLEKESAPQRQILNFLSNKQMLLLLDNFEQLLAEPANGAEVVTAVLQAAPAVKIIVTSRQKLNLRSEALFALEGLAFPDWQATADALSYSAVQLFVQSARRARVDFELTAHSLPPMARICRLTEGMPLAIVLAAAWVDMLSIAEIADEMQADIDFLESKMRDLPPRQRSMRAVFDYSWALLTEQEQAVLARLSVFQEGFTREAAQAVTGATLRQLLGLVNKSLIQRNVENGRFALHELLRQLAAEKLDATDKIDEVRTAHSRFYLRQLAAFATTRRALLALAPDTQNLKAAWSWGAKQGDTAHLLPIVEPLHIHFNLLGREFELFALWVEVLSLLPAGDSTFQNSTDDVIAVRASILNRLQETGYERDHRDQPIDIDLLYNFFRARGAKLDEAIACQHLAYRAIGQGDFPQAVSFFQTQARLYEEIKATFRLATSLAITAMMAYRAGQIEIGLALVKRALVLAEQSNDELNKLASLIALAFYTLHDQVDYETADQQYAAVSALGLELWEQGLTGNPAMIGLAWQGFIALLQGNLTQAGAFAEELKRIGDVRNNPREKGNATSFRSLLEATAGSYQAVDLSIFESVAVGHTEIASYSLILNACGLGNVEMAIAGIIRVWSQPMALRWPTVLLYVLPAAVFTLTEKGEYSRAASLLAAGRAHPACPRGWWGVMTLVQDLDARLQTELPPAEYAAAQAQGREMDVRETAVALLEELKSIQAGNR
jgi:predicted ATPase/DNA-binding SARP family transcriptional activator